MFYSSYKDSYKLILGQPQFKLNFKSYYSVCIISNYNTHFLMKYKNTIFQLM